MMLFFMLACQSVDYDKEKDAIQAQIDMIHKAHELKDADLFYKPNAASWIEVRQGTVAEVRKSEMLPGTQSYLDKMVFEEMIVRDEPIIDISKDGTLAGYIGAVIVKGRLDGSPVFRPVSFQSIFRKINGEWKIISTANTEADERTTASLLLMQSRKSLGNLDDNEVLSVYADAECKGPLASFRTLVLSQETDGKLEQVYGDMHSILKHGSKASWTYNVASGSLTETMTEEMKLSVVGHEMHWLSLWPEQRYSEARYVGISEFRGKTAFQIAMKNKLGRTIDFYYDFDTYFPLGFRSQLSDKIEDEVVVAYENWEKINHVSLFKKAVLTHGKEVFEYTFTDIRINQLKEQDFESTKPLLNIG